MAQLQDARVTAGALLELRPDLREQLVGDSALLHMSRDQAAVVQRAAARARDQLLDERTQLLRLRLGRLDGAVLNEGHRQAAHEGDLLLTRATELTSRFGVTHYSRSSSNSSSGAFAAAWLGAVPQSRIFTPSPFSS